MDCKIWLLEDRIYKGYSWMTYERNNAMTKKYKDMYTKSICATMLWKHGHDNHDKEKMKKCMQAYKIVYVTTRIYTTKVSWGCQAV